MAPFFREDVLRWLAWREVGYAIKVPFYRWLDLQQFIRNARSWTRVTAEVSGFMVPAVATPAGRTVLRLTNNPATERLFTRIEQLLPCAA